MSSAERQTPSLCTRRFLIHGLAEGVAALGLQTGFTGIRGVFIFPPGGLTMTATNALGASPAHSRLDQRIAGTPEAW